MTWQPGQSGNPNGGWKPGQSGNPAGRKRGPNSPLNKPKPLQVEGKDDANQYFVSGNKLGKGRPRGSRNRPLRDSFLEDDRSAPARQFRALVHRMAEDLGGVENLSAGQQQLIRRCAMISVACEQMEQKAAAGEAFDATAYGTLTGHLTRALRTLGLKREPREEVPRLQDYLNAARQPDGAFAIEEEGETAGNS